MFSFYRCLSIFTFYRSSARTNSTNISGKTTEFENHTIGFQSQFYQPLAMRAFAYYFTTQPQLHQYTDEQVLSLKIFTLQHTIQGISAQYLLSVYYAPSTRDRYEDECNMVCPLPAKKFQPDGSQTSIYSGTQSITRILRLICKIAIKIQLTFE